MTALLKRLAAKTKVVLSRPRPKAPDAEDALRLLERFLSAYWPETRTERTTDAAGEAALMARVPGRPSWIFTPAPGLRSFAPSDELATNDSRGWWDESEALPNDAAIGSAADGNGRRHARPSTAAIG